MDSGTKSDLISSLPDCLLVLIISFLPFKACVRTSVLSRRWRNLCLETKNLVFKESEFLNLSDFGIETIETTMLKRILFVRIMREWISKFTGEVIDNFEIYLSGPAGIEADITYLIEFAASKQVKNLVIDFSSYASNEIGVVEHFLTLIYYQNNGVDISHLLFNLIYVKNLTICSFLLQMIQDCHDPMELHDPMRIQHLVMKTNMHEDEFMGITIFLNSCPELESLTFDMGTTSRIVGTSSQLDPKTYWLANETYKCLETTLKIVRVKNFRGRSNELHVLQYLVRTGRVMEQLHLYEAKGLNHNQRRLVLAGAEEVQRCLKRASMHLQMTLYNST